MTGDLLEWEDALAKILDAVVSLPAECVPLGEALGRYAAQGVIAEVALPGFDNSAMDGYAISGPAAAGDKFRVIGVQAAGRDLGLRIGPGETARIFTGASLPAGTAAVVMQEDVSRSGDEIVINEAVQAGEFIRRAGTDLARGQRLFEAGAHLNAARLALLASQGVGQVSVGRRARVAVLSSGDELRRPGQTLGAGEIYDSNGVALGSLAAGAGAIVSTLSAAPDEAEPLREALALAARDHDVLVIAGGVSVGERDLVKDALTAIGVEIRLWRVRLKPGKPFLYGRSAQGTQVFGLPGNPVSAFVTFLLFARPALLKLMGAGNNERALLRTRAVANADLNNPGDRPHFQHGEVDADGRFFPTGIQQSHALFGLSRSNALVEVPAGQKIAAGEIVPAMRWTF